MDFVEWPAILQPRDILIVTPNKTKSLTTTLTEFEQVQPVIRPPWKVSLFFNKLVGPQILAWRAMIASLEGRSNLIRLPLFDLHYWPSDAEIASGAVPHSDGSEFADTSLYSAGDIEGVTVSGLQGEKRITVDFGQYGQIFQAGQYFGIANDPHIAKKVTWDDNVATIDFISSLRRDFTDAPFRLRPDLIARLTDDEGGELPLEYGRWSAPQLDFTEAFYEPLS